QLLVVLKKVNQLSTKDKEALFNQLEELEEEKISETFKLLEKTLEKRTEMTTQNMYKNDAINTKSTITNCLGQDFQRYDTVRRRNINTTRIIINDHYPNKLYL